jgi:hypothetical protein
MCFHISDKNPEPIVAQEKIIVYKYLNEKNGKIFSPIHYEFRWEPNKLNVTDFGIFEKKIYGGFHAYTTLTNCELMKDCYSEVCKMIIPKGATYYINDNRKEIVSNQMILKYPLLERICNFINNTLKF